MDGHGYSHMAVDTGSMFGWRSGTPILVANGVVEPNRILQLFRDDSARLPPEYASFVESKLQDFAEKTRAS
jgi:hypothetical protein